MGITPWHRYYEAVHLRAQAEMDSRHLSIPSYSTILRYMKDHAFIRKPLPRKKNAPGLLKAEQRLESREVRSYEAEYVNGLWHLDFHQGSLKVLTPEAGGCIRNCWEFWMIIPAWRVTFSGISTKPPKTSSTACARPS
jgi:hypothetical protein